MDSNIWLEILKKECIETIKDIDKIKGGKTKIDLPDDMTKLTKIKDQLLDEITKLEGGQF